MSLFGNQSKKYLLKMTKWCAGKFLLKDQELRFRRFRMFVHRWLFVESAVFVAMAVLPIAAELNEKGQTMPGHKVAFFSVSAVGHLQPLLSLAEEMAERGWEALVLSTEEVQDYVNSAALRNVTFLPMFCDQVWAKGMDDLRHYLQSWSEIANSNTWSVRWLTESQVWDCMYEKGLAILQQQGVDLMVIDVLTFAGFDIAEKLNVSYVVNHPIVPEFFAPMVHQNQLPMLLSGSSIHELGSFASLLQRIFLPFLRPLLVLYNKWNIYWPLDQKRARFGLNGKDNYDIHRNRLILVEHVLGVEYARPVYPLMHFVGHLERFDERNGSFETSLSSVEQEWLEGELPVIYVSFGTVFCLNKDRAKILLEGLSFANFRVLWSLKSFGDVNGSLPPNVRIAPWVSSQMKILAHPNVHAFISHCGDNSLYESIKMGTPLLCIPIALDQLDCAMRACDAGVARVLDKQSFTAEDIRGEIAYILQEQLRFQANLRRAQDLLKLAGGVTRAADLVEHVHAFGTQHLSTQDSQYNLLEIFNMDVLVLQLAMVAFLVFCWPCKRCPSRERSLRRD